MICEPLGHSPLIILCRLPTPHHWDCQEKKNVRLTPSMNLSSIATPDYGKMCPNFWFWKIQFNQLPITGLDLVSFGSFSMSLVQCLKFIIGASWTFFFSWHSQWQGVRCKLRYPSSWGRRCNQLRLRQTFAPDTLTPAVACKYFGGGGISR